MTFITSLLAFIVAIAILITVHELGHFLMARFFKFPTPVFSVGFGPSIFSFKRGDVVYRLAAIPLGGYVKILGMGYDESSILKGETPTILGTRWQRALILLAGPAMNIILALGLITVVYMVGVEAPAYLDKTPVVEYIHAGSPAEEAGIRFGDTILDINGREVKTWEAFQMEVVISGGDQVELTAMRDGEIVKIPLKIQEVGEYALGYVGVSPALYPKVEEVSVGGPAELAGLMPGDFITAVDGERVTYGLFSNMISTRPGEIVKLSILRGNETLEKSVQLLDQNGAGMMSITYRLDNSEFMVKKYGLKRAVQNSLEENLRDATLALRIVQRLIRGRGSLKNMSGPLDIARYSGEALRSGFNTFINLLGRISLQLGIFNLLPIPILDGGYLLILLIEGTRRKELSMKLKERVLTVGFYLLITLMLAVLYIDFVRNVFN